MVEVVGLAFVVLALSQFTSPGYVPLAGVGDGPARGSGDRQLARQNAFDPALMEAQ